MMPCPSGFRRTALLTLFFSGLGLAGLIGPGAVQVRAQPQRPDVRADLLVGGPDLEDASAIWLGVRIKLGPGWKTYWRSPGDSGLPPEFDWSKSKNLSQAELLWPAPRRTEILGVETIGYAREVIFPVKARVPSSAASSHVSLDLAVYACSTLCVREDFKLNATIGRAASSGDQQRLIDQSRTRVPGTRSESLSIGSIQLRDGNPPQVEVTARSKVGFQAPDIFVESDPPVFGSRPGVRYDPDGTATFTVTFDGASSADLRGRPLRLTLVDGEQAVEASTGPAAPAPATVPGSMSTPAPGPAFWVMLAIAFLGGFILNLMPCVLPVLSLKLLALVTHRDGVEPNAIRTGFAASAAGIVASFFVLASAMVALQGAGATIGWGIQFQQPVFLVVMAGILAFFAANLLGLFEIGLPFGLANQVGRIGRGNSLASHFGSGFVATLLATPCSAPFVGTAVGFALSRGAGEIYLVFAALGFGMALPYLIVAAAPKLATLLPRPGRWVLVVKQAMAVGLLATAAWLLTIAGTIAGAVIGWTTAVLLGVVLTGSWLQRAGSRTAKAVSLTLIAAPGALVGIVVLFGASVSSPTDDKGIPWRRFDESTIRSLVGEGRTVLVDITAAWCVTCKVNKALAFDDAEVAERLRNDVVPLQGDWTKPDERIASYLQTFGRYGIPFNVVYGPAAPTGIMLPELLSKGSVLDALEKAGTKASQLSSSR